jgi:hypothetical protein
VARQVQSDLNAQNGVSDANQVHVAMPDVAAIGLPEHLVAGVSQQAFLALQFSRIVKMFTIIDCVRSRRLCIRPELTSMCRSSF